MVSGMAKRHSNGETEMIRIEIDSVDTFPRSGTSGKGKPYKIVEQAGYAVGLVNRDTGKAGKYPVAVRFALADDAKPYPVGTYTVDDKSFSVGQYGDLQVARLFLSPVPK